MLIKVLVPSCFNVTTKVTSKLVFLEFVCSATFFVEQELKRVTNIFKTINCPHFKTCTFSEFQEECCFQQLKRYLYISKPLIVTSFTFSSFSYFYAVCNEEETLRHTRVRFFYLYCFIQKTRRPCPRDAYKVTENGVTVEGLG